MAPTILEDSRVWVEGEVELGMKDGGSGTRARGRGRLPLSKAAPWSSGRGGEWRKGVSEVWLRLASCRLGDFARSACWLVFTGKRTFVSSGETGSTKRHYVSCARLG